jgi:hypothetical protein
MRRLEPRRATSKALKDSDYKCERKGFLRTSFQTGLPVSRCSNTHAQHSSCHASQSFARMLVWSGALISSRPARPYGCIAENSSINTEEVAIS